MEQSNNQRQPDTDQIFTKDDAYQTLGIINTWINNIDTKVSYALALAGILIGIIFSSGLPNAFKKIAEVSKLKELNGGEVIAAVMVGMLYIISFLSIVSFLLAIIARVKDLNKVSSLFFFGSIGKMELQDYKDLANQSTEKNIIEDLEEQIHTNSRICTQKAKWYNKGAKLLAITIVLWFICMVFRLI